MGLLEDLKQGRGGVRLAVPPRLTVDDDRDDVAGLHDAERGVVWHLSRYDHHLDLRPEHHERLARDVELHTRALFDTYSRSLSPKLLRTKDPTWSPVVSVERVRLGAQDALTVIHRMSYQPCNEMLMGHLLVPVRPGLFELRVLAPSNTTGLRESVLFASAMKAAGEPPEVILKRLGQKHYDDPEHDARFPEHPLSRVRAELRAILEEGLVAVTEPDEPHPEGEALLPALGCAVTPPPRYVRLQAAPCHVQWSRLSFAGTDGVELLTVMRDGDRELPERGRKQRLRKIAEQDARASVPEGSTDVSVTLSPLPDRDGRAQVLTYLAYDPNDGSAPRHTAFHWFVDDEGRPVAIAIATGRCVPKDELLADTEAVAASWRPLDRRAKPPQPTKKPWWKVW